MRLQLLLLSLLLLLLLVLPLMHPDLLARVVEMASVLRIGKSMLRDGSVVRHIYDILHNCQRWCQSDLNTTPLVLQRTAHHANAWACCVVI
jgi:hypothetical protein